MASSKRTETLHIPEARFINPDGTTQLVQPVLEESGAYLRPGRAFYNASQHKNKLLCPYCDLRVDFNKGSGAIICGTQLGGTRAHFKKAPKQDHEPTCKLPKTAAPSDSEIDHNAPYRIHLNILMGGKADSEHPVYERAQGGKVIAHDPRLQPEEVIIPGNTPDQKKVIKRYKESVSVKSVQDLIDLMRRGEKARLMDSLVVHTTIVPWMDFAILDDKSRMRHLVNRLKNGASHPVLLHVGLYSAAEGKYAEGAKLFYERDEQGAHFITPRIYMDGLDTQGSFPTRGNYLVVGMARIKFNEKSRNHFLNISLKEPAQVEFCNLGDLRAEARVQAAKRQMAPTPISAP